MNPDWGVVNRFVREVPFIGGKVLVVLHRATLCDSVMADYLGNLTEDRNTKEIGVSGIYACDGSGNGSEERAIEFAKLLGVRDGSSRDATTAEMTKVAKNLYLFLVKKYHEGLKSGKWKKWDEERYFPRHEFEDHS